MWIVNGQTQPSFLRFPPALGSNIPPPNYNAPRSQKNSLVVGDNSGASPFIKQLCPYIKALLHTKWYLFPIVLVEKIGVYWGFFQVENVGILERSNE